MGVDIVQGMDFGFGWWTPSSGVGGRGRGVGVGRRATSKERVWVLDFGLGRSRGYLKVHGTY